MALNEFGFIGTISDGEDVPVEDETSESDEEAVEVKKKVKKTKHSKKASNEFGLSFSFDDKGGALMDQFSYDPLQFAKQKQGYTSLDEKITKLKKKKQNKGAVGDKEAELLGDDNIPDEENQNDENEDEPDDESEVMPETKDTVKSKGKKKSKASKDGQMSYSDNVETHDESLAFADMNLSRPLLKALSVMTFDRPTPIQSACIPRALLGRDLCACAMTGSGKTAAFMLPILERLLYKPRSEALTRVLVLVPTRELAVQVHQVARQLAQYTKIDISLSVGGLDLKAQEAALRLGPDVVIATPGRLIDHVHNSPNFSLSSIEILVLDEADRMLDEYFAEQMKEVIRLCSRNRQTMLFSATMTEEVTDLAAVSLSSPVRVFVNQATDVAMTLRQEFVRIRSHRETDREAIVAALVTRTFHDRCMVFVQTKVQAHRMHILLGLLGTNVGELHGNLSQTQRLEALRDFKDGSIDVLLATDVAARGLDIADVKTVINLTMPGTLKHYIHRVGRTARAGKSGRSISLAGESEKKLLKEIVKKATNPVKSRIVSREVVDRFCQRIEALEPDVISILAEEREERQMRSAEIQTNRAEKILQGDKESEDRTWFQTNQERKREKDSLALEKRVGRKGKRVNGRGSKITPEDRVNYEMGKAQAYAARAAKRIRKPKRMRSCPEDSEPASSAKKSKKAPGKKSAFHDALTDTSRRAVKGFRHQGHQKKSSSHGGKRGRS